MSVRELLSTSEEAHPKRSNQARDGRRSPDATGAVNVAGEIGTAAGGAAGGGAAAISSSRARARYYYSGSLYDDAATAHWRLPPLLSQLSPLEPLHLEDVPGFGADEPVPPPADTSAHPRNHTSLRLWLTSGGVLARTHYDKSHNMLCVVRGRKKVVLWPPGELPALHLYPAIHAAHRQSQVSALRLDPAHAAVDAAHAERSGTTAAASATDGAVDGAADVRAPGGVRSGSLTPATVAMRGVIGEFELVDGAALVGARNARGATLERGDCMYVPPYWAHAVHSPEPSIALAAFSTSWEQARWARSGWLAVPLGRFVAGGLCSKARGAALLITAFVHACTPFLAPSTPRAFLAKLYASRYAPLYGALHDDGSAALGAAVGERSSSAGLADCLAASDGRTLPPEAPERDAALVQRVRAFAGRVAALLTQPDHAAGGRTYDRGVAMELAADYVEEIAGWACGAPGAWRLLRLLARTHETDVGHESHHS